MFRFPLRSIFALALYVLLSAGAGAQVPIPSAEFVPVTDGDFATRSVPFLSQADALARRGYIEEEYLISGTAGVYDYVDNASQSPLVSLVQSATPYVTRLIVRRPVNPQRFRGAVVFDILNATRGYDSDIVWHCSQDMIMDKGRCMWESPARPTP